MKKRYITIVGAATLVICVLICLLMRAPQKHTQAAVSSIPATSSNSRVTEIRAQPATAASRSDPEIAHDAPHVIRPPDLPPVLEPVKIGDVAWKIPTEKWQDVGRSSVGAAIQSQYWAISRGDLDYIRKAIAIDESAKPALESLLDQVSPEVRAQYPTPEDLAAFFVASVPTLAGIAIGRVLEDRSRPDDISVSIKTLEPGADRFGGTVLRFRLSSDGEWIRVIEPREIAQWREMAKWDKELSKSRKWAVLK